MAPVLDTHRLVAGFRILSAPHRGRRALAGIRCCTGLRLTGLRLTGLRRCGGVLGAKAFAGLSFFWGWACWGADSFT
eukprot:693256-Prorocentrum_minimum.AAC.1